MNNDINASVLEWDSNFFGFPIARINQRKIIKSDSVAINKFCMKNNIRLLQFQCEVNDAESILAAESMGFHFADYRVNYSLSISEKAPLNIKLPDNYSIDYARKEDISNLQEIAGVIYKDSRYYFDKNFPRSKVEEFYKNWVAKSVLGEFDDYAVALYCNLLPIGFICIAIEADTARFSLVGMRKEHAGRGFGTSFIRKVIWNLSNHGIKFINTTTQGRNISAQNFYNKAGFNINFVEIYYHYWVD